MPQLDHFTQKIAAESTQTSALQFTELVQVESAKVGFDFLSIQEPFQKVQEEIVEMSEAFENREQDPAHFEEELGDCFFSLVNLARWANINPEDLVRKNAEKFLSRCSYIETQLAASEKNWADTSPEEIFVLWKSAKKSGL